MSRVWNKECVGPVLGPLPSPSASEWRGGVGAAKPGVLGVRGAGGWGGVGGEGRGAGHGGMKHRADDTSVSWGRVRADGAAQGPPRRTLGAGVGAVPAVFYVNGAPWSLCHTAVLSVCVPVIVQARFPAPRAPTSPTTLQGSKRGDG